MAGTRSRRIELRSKICTCVLVTVRSCRTQLSLAQAVDVAQSIKDSRKTVAKDVDLLANLIARCECAHYVDAAQDQ